MRAAIHLERHHEVEAAAADLFPEIVERRQSSGTVEHDVLVHIRVRFDECMCHGLDDPGDPGIGPGPLQGRDDRHAVDHVADRAQQHDCDRARRFWHA